MGAALVILLQICCKLKKYGQNTERYKVRLLNF